MVVSGGAVVVEAAGAQDGIIARVATQVVALPGAGVEGVIAVAAEQIVLDYVRSPGPKTAAVLTEKRKEFRAVVAKLTQRVKR